MSFSMKAKNELTRLVPERRCCQRSELSALIKMCGTVKWGRGGELSISIVTENAALARKIFTLIKDFFHIHTEVMVRKKNSLKKNNMYIISISHGMGVKGMLKTLGIITESPENGIQFKYGIDFHMISGKCCRRAYLRGVFLGGGSVSDPEKTYHLEIVTHNQQLAEEISNLINRYNLISKIIVRKNKYVVYLKDGNQIVDFLNFIGAHNALMSLENIRIVKEMRNNVNRLVNCETANLSKTINASVRQVENIKFLIDVIGYDKLPENLKEIAEVRINYPEASLIELGQLLSKPLGKSGVNHRLRKLEEMAAQLKIYKE